MAALEEPWPGSDAELVALQGRLVERSRRVDRWRPPTGRAMRVGGCFVAFARGEAGPGHPGDRAWAAAVVLEVPAEPGPGPRRDPDRQLRGIPVGGAPRQARDVEAQHAVAGTVPASYAPGLLARREGPILEAAVRHLPRLPEVLLVDATGLDHPRRAGLALHLGSVLEVPTVGVTHRGLVDRSDPPDLAERGAWMPVEQDGVAVGAWLCVRSGVRPVLVHAAWRTGVEDAVEVVLRASVEDARTPVPLQEARRVAREARHLATADGR
ncbi:MAG: endonuclease V [Acidimicrobiales bacterium]|nr:endonuclease V [Acidimicrobiales bacterium]